MGVIAEAFRTGGVWMYLILAASLIGWPLSVLGVIAAFVSPRAKYSLVIGGFVVLVGVATIAAGGIGYMMGMAEVEEAVELASPDVRPRLLAKGEQLSTYPLYFGLGGGSVPLLLGGLAVAVGLSRRGDE